MNKIYHILILNICNSLALFADQAPTCRTVNKYSFILKIYTSFMDKFCEKKENAKR